MNELYTKYPKLRVFEEHNSNLNKEVGDQVLGDCVFCGKAGHFYVNKEKGLWDCKVCGSSGNINSYLYQLGMMYHKNLFDAKHKDKLDTLSANRGLPISAFKKWLVGWDETERRYTIPVVTGKNVCSDIRLYKLKMKTRASAGASAGMFNIHKIDPSLPIYICEGEWDGMALDWLLGKINVKANVVAVPGAAIFKREWLPSFRGCDVQCLYDNDTAGEQAEIKVQQLLSGTAKSVKYIQWLSALPMGYDIRDWVKHGIKVQKLLGCWRNLKKLFVSSPRVAQVKEAEEIPDNKVATASGEKIDLETELAVYRKWLHLPDKYVLDVMFGSIFANLYMSGDPVWMFLIAPPGGSKSELLMSLIKSASVMCLTSLTPHSLISGFSWGTTGKDPSLLPQLDGKVLVLKDFTTITAMHFTARDEIFGILRDAYDGKTEKQFGNGLRREYKSKFGIIAGTTPIIDTFSTIHQSLGERFLKYRIEIDTQFNEDKKIMQALSNINSEVAMREELIGAASRILAQPAPKELPAFPTPYLKKVSALAQFCAKMRGVVFRDHYTQQVLYRPSSEVGTRLAKQLMKLAIGVGIFRGVKVLGEYEYHCMGRVALHTCPDRLVAVIQAIYRSGVEDNIPELKTKEISDYTRLPTATIFRLLEDLYLLKLIKRTGEGAKYYWSLDEGIVKLLTDSKLFEGVEQKTAS